LDHPLGDVMDEHGVDGHGFAGIEQFKDSRATLWLECDLAAPVLWFGVDRFRVEYD
jgi:hypothetical protein